MYNASAIKINFDGLNVVAIFHTPGNMLTGPKWDVALYIDERATKEQIDTIGTVKPKNE